MKVGPTSLVSPIKKKKKKHRQIWNWKEIRAKVTVRSENTIYKWKDQTSLIYALTGIDVVGSSCRISHTSKPSMCIVSTNPNSEPYPFIWWAWWWAPPMLDTLGVSKMADELTQTFFFFHWPKQPWNALKKERGRRVHNKTKGYFGQEKVEIEANGPRTPRTTRYWPPEISSTYQTNRIWQGPPLKRIAIYSRYRIESL